MKFSFIWDMDGTLVDSYPSIVPSVKTVCEAYGADYDQEFIHDSVIHTSVGDFFRKMAKEYGLNPEELTGRFNHLNDTNIDSILPIPHAEETLKLLCEKGHQNFVIMIWPRQFFVFLLPRYYSHFLLSSYCILNYFY